VKTIVEQSIREKGRERGREEEGGKEERKGGEIASDQQDTLDTLSQQWPHFITR
jgi:hypothetical protein